MFVCLFDDICVSYLSTSRRCEVHEEVVCLLRGQVPEGVPELEGAVGIEEGGAESEGLRGDVEDSNSLDAHISCPHTPKVNRGAVVVGQDQLGLDGRGCHLQIQSVLSPAGGGREEYALKKNGRGTLASRRTGCGGTYW